MERRLIPSATRVTERSLQAAQYKTSCIIAVGEWDGHQCLLKNRDRNYTPKVSIYHELLEGVEVLYLKDEVTNWCEGLNEYGIGVVNSALEVIKDEEEGEISSKGLPLRDGARMLAAIKSRTPEDAIEAIRTYKGGLKGHTFIATPTEAYCVESVSEGGGFHVRKLPKGKMLVRTNHGHVHPDAGYTKKKNEAGSLSSVTRREKAMRALREAETPEEIAPSIYGKRRKDLKDPLNMVKISDEGMNTTTQMVLDLTDLTAYLYLLPDQVEYLGYKNKLPKGRKPKLKLNVYEYTPLDEKGEFEIEPVKKKAGEVLPLMDPLFNLREAAKQLLLLEDHLAHPQKFCPDCIRKHLLCSEAFLEEAVTLDKTGELNSLLAPLPGEVRKLWKGFQEKSPSQQLGQQVRVLRKKLILDSSAVKVASKFWAKYKEKKKVPKADGTGDATVYVYSDRQIANRNKEKAERIEKFSKNLSDLRSKYRKALESEDPKERLTALAVGLIDETYERVGNDDSADNGHFGVTGWKKEHITFTGEKALLKYVGKSGVDHEKEVTDAKLVSALKEAVKEKKPGDKILCDGDECVVSAKDVNAFLEEFDVTAKDLRGLHANNEMKARLKALRSKGGALPKEKKEKEKILKAEFKEALEGAAEAVGHTPSMLRGSYLVPGLEEAFVKDGTVLEKLDKKGSANWTPKLIHLLAESRGVPWDNDPSFLEYSERVTGVAHLDDMSSTQLEILAEALSQGRRATKTQGEREDEAAEGLIKPSPKIKPPRTDLQHRREPSDEEKDPDEKQEEKDSSNNDKDASLSSYRVALRHFFSKEDMVSVRRREDGKVVQVTKKTLNENKSDYEEIEEDGEGGEEGGNDGEESGEAKEDPHDLSSPEGLDKFRASLMKKYKDLGLSEDRIGEVTSELSSTSSPGDIDAAKGLLEWEAQATEKENQKTKAETEKKEKHTKMLTSIKERLKSSLGGSAREVQEVLGEYTTEQLETLQAEMEQEQEKLLSLKPEEYEKFKAQAKRERELLEDTTDLRTEALLSDPKKLAGVLAKQNYLHEVLDNPTTDLENPVPSSGAPIEGKDLDEVKKKAVDRAMGTVKKYQKMKPEDRKNHFERVTREIEGLKEGDPRRVHLEGLAKGISVAGVLQDGDNAKGVGATVARLFKAAKSTGNMRKLMTLGSLAGSEVKKPEDQNLVRGIYEGLTDSDWEGMVPEDHPGKAIVTLLNDPSRGQNMNEGDRAKLRSLLTDMMVGEYTFLDPVSSGDTLGEKHESLKKLRGETYTKPPKAGDVKGTENWILSMLKAMAGKAKSLAKQVTSPERKNKHKYRTPDSDGEYTPEEDPPPKKKKVEHKPGDIWESKGSFWAKDDKGNTVEFDSREKAQNWVSGDSGERMKRGRNSLRRVGYVRDWDFTPWPSIDPYTVSFPR